MAEVPIVAKGVGKLFRIPHEKRATLFASAAGLLLGKSQSFEDFWALKGVSFTVKEGEVLGVVGRNGCGKSTLLRIVGNIYQPTTGEVRVQGRVMPFIELGVGFQGALSGRENAYLYGSILGMPRRLIDAKYGELVQFAELEDFMDLPIKDYSSGMLLRLAFATSVMADPEIMLIDEVLSVGDAAFQKKCMDKMEELRARSRAIMFVSHNPEQVKAICTSALLLHHGEKRAEGAPEDVLKEYARIATEK